jgi:hypothetical protein
VRWWSAVSGFIGFMGWDSAIEAEAEAVKNIN